MSKNPLTNKYGFSELMVQAMSEKPRVRVGASDYSATSLINPPRLVQLKKRHADKITMDYKDSWLMWLGNAVHSRLERGLKLNPRYLVEEKITRHDLDRRVVCIFDAYDTETKTLYDHKTTTTFIHGGEAKEDWMKQLNINAHFLEMEGYPVERASINAVYVDWRPSIAKFKPADAYPQLPHAEVPCLLLPPEERKKFYLSRLQKHIDAEKLKDDELPACTSEEMWEKPSTYAVKQKNVYIAKRVLGTEAEAIQWMDENKDRFKNLYIEERPAVRTRCEQYCDAAPYCNQYKEWKAAQNGKS